MEKRIEAQTSRFSLIQRLLPCTIISHLHRSPLLSANLFRWWRISRPSQRKRSKRSELGALSQQPTNWSQHLLYPRNLRVFSHDDSSHAREEQRRPANQSHRPSYIFEGVKNSYSYICTQETYMYITHDFSVSRILSNDQRLSSTHFSSPSDLELRFVHTDEYADRRGCL